MGTRFYIVLSFECVCPFHHNVQIRPKSTLYFIRDRNWNFEQIKVRHKYILAPKPGANLLQNWEKRLCYLTNHSFYFTCYGNRNFEHIKVRHKYILAPKKGQTCSKIGDEYLRQYRVFFKFIFIKRNNFY